MSKADFTKYEQKVSEIKEKYKALRKKQTLIFWLCDAAAVIVVLFILKLIFKENYLQWFIISLLFTFVFPTTMHSKKLKQLNKIEQEQIRLAENQTTKYGN